MRSQEGKICRYTRSQKWYCDTSKVKMAERSQKGKMAIKSQEGKIAMIDWKAKFIN